MLKIVAIIQIVILNFIYYKIQTWELTLERKGLSNNSRIRNLYQDPIPKDYNLEGREF